MNVYLSYPMTIADKDDLVQREVLRNALNTCNLSLNIYDPEINEPAGLELWQLQAIDITEMSQADVLVINWSKSCDRSKGVAAEIEWAVRWFQLPIIVYFPYDRRDLDILISPWTKASLATGHALFCANLRDVVKELAKIAPKEHHEQRND